MLLVPYIDRSPSVVSMFVLFRLVTPGTSKKPENTPRCNTFTVFSKSAIGSTTSLLLIPEINTSPFATLAVSACVVVGTDTSKRCLLAHVGCVSYTRNGPSVTSMFVGAVMLTALVKLTGTSISTLPAPFMSSL